MDNEIKLQDLLDALTEEKFKSSVYETGLDILTEKCTALEKECARLAKRNKKLKRAIFYAACFGIGWCVSLAEKRKNEQKPAEETETETN